MLDLAPADLAGPAALGRSLLVGPRATVPEPWDGLEEVAADANAGADLVERLHRAWRTRQPIVIRWSGARPTAPERPPERRPFHQLTVDDELPGERLAFAVTANAIDLLDDPPRFAPLEVAIRLGAEAVPVDTDLDPLPGGHRPEVRLRDGRTAVVDGGPLDIGLPSRLAGGDIDTDGGPHDGTPVIPRAHLVAGSLRPMVGRAGPVAELAPDQLAAVAHGSGAARILAPAGSGKTRVLTERARFVTTRRAIDPRSVCMVAYNRRAKDEMQERLTDVPGFEIRTLNSLALAIATGSGPFGDGSEDRPVTIDELEARRLLDRIVPGRRRRKLSDPLESWIDALSACRLGLRDPHEIEAAYGGDVAGFPEVFDQYRARLAETNRLDFDEQILRAIDRLLNEPAVRDRARSVAPILLVDEFQDLTPAHLLLIRLLAGPGGEVFGVGDDDQTIYGYAGASPDWLIEFDRFFPGAADHRLTVNYRCPRSVVEAAVNLLSHNRHRVPKEIRAGSPAAPDDRGPRGLAVMTEGDPQDNLVAHVERLIEGGAEPSEIAILARVHAALLPAAVHLRHAGVPVVRPPGLTPAMLERSGVGAAVSWLRLAAGPAQGFRADDLRLALRRPPRSLHPRIADWACEQRSVKDLLALAGRLNTERDAETVTAFAQDIDALRTAAEGGAGTERLLEHVCDDIGLLGAASQLDRSQRTARRAAHADELAALIAVARLHPEPAGFGQWLADQIESMPPFRPDDPPAGATLATIHTTKGLEWPHVIVHDVRSGLYPHSLADDTEEERRIFHVGVTRGRESVGVTVSGPPSPFVAELAEARPADEPWPEQQLVLSASTPAARLGKQGAPGGEKAARAAPTSPAEAALRDARGRVAPTALEGRRRAGLRGVRQQDPRRHRCHHPGFARRLGRRARYRTGQVGALRFRHPGHRRLGHPRLIDA